MLARSILLGNARASICGTSKSNSSHIFLYAAILNNPLTFLKSEPGNGEAYEKFGMKKEIIYSCIPACSCLMSSPSLHAQENVHIGVLGGMHISKGTFSDLNNNYFSDPKSVSGTTFGAFVELDMNEHFSLRPELMVVKRGTKLEDIQHIVKLRRWTSNGYSFSVIDNPGRLSYKLDAKYTDMRVPIIYNFCNPGDIRPYLYVAPVLGLVTGGDISLTDKDGTYSVDISKANMASTYFAGQIGLGVKFPLGPIDLGIEANYELGFTDTYGSKEKDGYNPQNEMFVHFETMRIFPKNETSFSPPSLYGLITLTKTPGYLTVFRAFSCVYFVPLYSVNYTFSSNLTSSPLSSCCVRSILFS